MLLNSADVREARNRKAALVRHYGAGHPKVAEADRAFQLAKLAAARARLAEQEAGVVALLLPDTAVAS